MNQENRYTQFALVREMLETPKIISNFRRCSDTEVLTAVRNGTGVLFTGEGSSRIFPGKNAVRWNMTAGLGFSIHTEGSRQAAEYRLGGRTVFGSSNSGQTRELIELFALLRKQGHQNRYGVTAHTGTKLEELSTASFILNCGEEAAVAATKSVVEQALFYQDLLYSAAGKSLDTAGLSGTFEAALTAEIPETLTKAAANAETIYFAGRNDGVAEELTLKTNEITRKRSGFLEGTYAVHGIEEVLTERDVVIIIDPFEAEMEKFRISLEQGVGCPVFAIASRPTLFPTLTVDECGPLLGFVLLAMGWNLLVEIGTFLGIDLDHPKRARKIGNEYTG